MSRRCLLWSSPLKAPVDVPFEITPETVAKAEMWLKEEYASSSFNNCPHQSLPLMSGLPPLIGFHRTRYIPKFISVTVAVIPDMV